MPDQLARLDAWIAKQKEPRLGRPEAIRRVLDQALPPAAAPKRGKAKELRHSDSLITARRKSLK
jgi:hypothetical protein